MGGAGYGGPMGTNSPYGAAGPTPVAPPPPAATPPMNPAISQALSMVSEDQRVRVDLGESDKDSELIVV